MPAETAPREKYLSIRLNDEERAAIDKAAALCGESPSGWSRKWLLIWAMTFLRAELREDPPPS